MTRDLADTVPSEVLEAFGYSGASADPFDKGLVNRHWLVSVDDRLAVFRRYHLNRSAAAAAWEQMLVEYAGAKGWPVSVPLRASNGATLLEHAGRLWAAGPYLDGADTPDDRPARYHILGRLLGRLHHDLSGFEVEGQRPDFGKTWELDAWIAPANVGTFNELLTEFGKTYPDLAAVVRRQRYRNLRDLSRLHYPDLPDMTIHGDFHRSNLLWKEGQLTGLLDFDQSRRDALACDLALLLMPHMPLDLRLASALLEGYQAVRPLSDVEWELLPSLVRASLLWWVAYVLVEWRTNGGAPDSVARTMTVRLPAFEAAEPSFRALRRTTAV
ncbi:MAG: phosphotransferase [bacterium]